MPVDPSRLKSVLETIASEALRERLRQILSDGFEGVVTRQEVERLAKENKLTGDEVLLILAKVASAYARPAISNYPVGAIALGSSGDCFYMGANLEFEGSALSFTLHAEQAAVANAWTHGEEGLLLLAVDEPPCGYCRQFLYELTTAEKLTVLLQGEGGPVRKPLTHFLPEAFGPKNLEWGKEKEEALMDREDHQLELIEESQDPVVLKALEAANNCYAPLPYTPNRPSYAGVAIETEEGAEFEGRLAENAAFNPSLSPLEAAMTMWNFGTSEDGDNVKRVVLVQVQGTVASQTKATEAVIAALAGPPAFEEHWARLPLG